MELRNNKVESIITTFVSFVLMFLLLYPVTIVLTTIIVEEVQVIHIVTSIIIYMCLGYLVGYVVRNLSNINKIMLLFIIGIIISIIQVYINHSTGLTYYLFQSILVLSFYILGFRLSLSELSATATKGGMFFLIVVIIIAYYRDDLAQFKNLFFVFAYLYLFISVILESRNNLKTVFNKRSIQGAEVQNKIQNSNLKLITIFFVFLVLLFNIKSIVLVLLSWTEFIIYRAIWLIVYIISLLSSDSQGTEEAPYSEPTFPEHLPTEDSSWPLYISIIFLIIAIYAILKLTPYLIKKIRQGISCVMGLLQRFLTYEKKNDIEETEECVDYIEIKKSSDSIKKRKENKTSVVSRMKLLKKTKNHVEKIRILYAMILEILNKDITINRSDTTNEIYKKWSAKIKPDENFKEVTGIYDKVRYGEILPEEKDIVMMEEYLSKIDNSNKS